MRNLPQTFLKYAIAVVVAVAALFLRKLLDPLLGTENAYHTVWLAVMFSAFYCGTIPSILTLAISAAGVWYWLLPRYDSTFPSHATKSGMIGFLLLSVVIIVFGEFTRRIVVKRQRAEDELKKSHAELEAKVQERTAVLAERTAALERKTAEVLKQAAMLDSANDAIFVRSASDTISYWNKGAERLYGWTKEEALGRSPHDLLHTEFPEPVEHIKALQTWEGEIHHTKRDGTKIIIASHWTALRDSNNALRGWLEINTDITRRKRAEEAARSLSGRILALQDEERRRIAKELHDSLGQYLVALKMNLDGYAAQQAKLNAIASESSDIVDKCLAETRTISHLLHPPLLDEAGFNLAARDYIEGFSRRSGISVEFNAPPPEVVRLQPDIELMLFRTVQEALTNVHKHSGASKVVINLTMDEKQAHLQITDNGKGIPPERLDQLTHGVSEMGVGLAGMRERTRQFNGTFDIRSNASGTVITVTAPRLELSVPDHTGVASAA